jgi:hypothetical protein
MYISSYTCSLWSSYIRIMRFMRYNPIMYQTPIIESAADYTLSELPREFLRRSDMFDQYQSELATNEDASREPIIAAGATLYYLNLLLYRDTVLDMFDPKIAASRQELAEGNLNRSHINELDWHLGNVIKPTIAIGRKESEKWPRKEPRNLPSNYKVAHAILSSIVSEMKTEAEWLPNLLDILETGRDVLIENSGLVPRPGELARLVTARAKTHLFHQGGFYHIPLGVNYTELKRFIDDSYSTRAVTEVSQVQNLGDVLFADMMSSVISDNNVIAYEALRAWQLQTDPQIFLIEGRGRKYPKDKPQNTDATLPGKFELAWLRVE